MAFAPKPANFDALSRAWNDPEVFARELADYYAQLGRSSTGSVDFSEPRRAARHEAAT